MSNINTQKIGKFIKSLKGAEYLYAKHIMGMRDEINDLIKKHNLLKKEFCILFGINESEYEDFIMGNRNYDVRDMAALNNAFMELESKKLQKKMPIKVEIAESKW